MIRRLVLFLLLIVAGRLEAVTLIAGANGNFTAAATWQLVDATSYLDSEAGTVVVGVANIDSAVFVPGVITVDGVAVKVSSRNAVPGANTFTVTLRNSTAGADVASVTINVSDIDAVAPGGWYFVNFGNQVLLPATNYIVRCVASAASMVTLYRNATANNVSRMLRTSTTQAPAAGDQLHVLGEWTAAATVTARTVTMDETAATSYGPTVAGGPPQGATIGNNGTLTWGTTAATNYILYLKGILRIYPGGTMNIGTVGTPMPSTSTAIYQMTSVATVDSGLIVDGTLNVYGATKNNVATLLTANLAGAGTVLTLASTAGWAALDVIAIASTSQTAAECESGTIKSVDSPTQVTLTAGVANAHSGTSPTQAEVVNLTRNVVLRGSASNLFGYIFVPSGVVEMHYAEVYWFGSNIAGKRGLEVTSTGGVTLDYTSMHDNIGIDSHSIYMNTAARNIALDHLVMYSVRRFPNVGGPLVTWTMDDSVLIRQNDGPSLDGVATLTNVTMVGSTSTLSSLASPIEFNNVTWHSNGGGVVVGTAASGWVVNTASVWRNKQAAGSAPAFRFNNPNVTAFLTDVTAFGNETQTATVEADNVQLYWTNLTSNGDSTFATTRGIRVFAGVAPFFIYLVDSSFSVAAGIKTAHTDDLFFDNAGAIVGQIFAWNTTLAGTSAVTNLTTITPPVFGPISSGVYSQKQDGTAGDHRRYLVMGNALTNTVTFRTASPSEELIPSSASVKMESGPKQAAVAAAGTVTWSVWVYKSVGYAGAQPRLMLRANPAIGIAADTLLDTMAGGAGAWEELTGVTPAAAGDAGVFEAFVDCDTSGSIYVDDWSANGTLISENRGWWNGTPMIVAGGQPIGGDTYWWTGAPAVGFPPTAPSGGATPVFNNPILISRRQRIGATQ